MDRIATPSRTKETIAKHGFHLSKSLGQNFLIDQNIISRIIDGAEVNSATNVLEIGPGIGSLTQELCERAKKVVAVEIDKALIPILKETLDGKPNIEVINADILKVDINEIIREHFSGGDVKVIGNLPYYITTPIIMKCLEEKIPVKAIVIMIQKEVADRMKAKPGGKDYGALSVAVQYYCDVENVVNVPPSVFIPQPKVESSVIRLRVLEKPRVKVLSEAIFFGAVKDSFGKRRKTLLNALSSGTLKLSKELVREVLSTCGIDEKRRGETLSLEEFACLSNEISRRAGNI